MKAEDFQERFGPYADRAARELGMPRGVILAQWALETATGESELAARANNLGGIKYVGQDAAAGACGEFAAYPSIDAFTDDYIRVLSLPGHGYPAVRTAATPDETIRALQVSGYAEEGYAGLPGLYHEAYASLDVAPAEPAGQAAVPPEASGGGRGPEGAGVAVLLFAGLGVLILLALSGR